MDSLTTSKKRILEILNQFPETIIVEDFIARIIIETKIEEARDQIKKGNYFTEEELDEEIKNWN